MMSPGATTADGGRDSGRTLPLPGHFRGGGAGAGPQVRRMPRRAQPPTLLSGVLLAAGRSSRMGRDKALLTFKGRRLWRRQRDVLRAAGAAELLLSARPDQAWARGRDVCDVLVTDSRPGMGPLAGVVAALEHAAHVHLMVLAIDLPLLPAPWFRKLLAGCGPDTGAVGVRAGRFEPLAAVYPRRFLPLARNALARGEPALQPLLEDAVDTGVIGTRPISSAEAHWFENWNSPAEIKGAR